MTLVAVAGFAALGGAYPAAAVPLLVLSAAAFLLTGARVAAHQDTRALDLALLAALGVMLVQTVRLPGPVVSLLSPHAWSLQAMLHLEPVRAAWPLSIDVRLTRAALMEAAAAVLLFWAAREAFTRGGVRLAARTIAWTGFAVTMVALAQRATAPLLLLWQWRPPDPGSQPLGPFVNPNHFAAWLVMAAGLTAGYLVAHRRSHQEHHSSKRLLLRDWLADGRGLVLAGSLVVMLLGVAASLSRAAILGAIAALGFTAPLVRRQGRGRAGLPAGAIVIAMLLAAAVWGNREGLERKFQAATAVSRIVIWRETLPLLTDYWLTGTGAGTYTRAMLHYQRTTPEFHYNQAHSEYVQIAAEGGLLLGLPVLFAAGAWVALARRRLQRERNELYWVRAGAAAGILALAVQALFETALRVPANALLCALLAAVVVHESRAAARDGNADGEERPA